MDKEPKKDRSDEGCFCSTIANLPTDMADLLRSKGGLENMKAQVPDKVSLSSDVALFKALSDPVRLQILSALSIADLCPCILKELTDLSSSKLSYHLNILEDAGLISCSSLQKWRIYSLTEFSRDTLNLLSSLKGA